MDLNITLAAMESEQKPICHSVEAKQNAANEAIEELDSICQDELQNEMNHIRENNKKLNDQNK